MDYTLYLVTDSLLLKGRSLVEEVIKGVNGGVSLVQLREKNLCSRDIYQLGMELQRELKTRGVPLIINDRLDIALAIDADGLHIGQSDLPLNVIRSLLGPEKIIGLSASNEAQALQGQKQGASYLGLGPVFPTATKSDAASPTGLELLYKVKRLVDLPLVAIGGITMDNMSLIKATGVDGMAVVSALMGSIDIEKTARKMVQIWRNA